MISITELPQLHSDAASEQAQSTEPLRVCVVVLGEETFAMDFRHVRGVFEPDSITRVPGMPAALIGVTNLRGTILPLADVRSALGVASAIRPKYAVVVHHGTQQVGILVESVPEIRTIQSEHPAPSSPRTAGERCSMVSSGGVLNIAHLWGFIEGTIDDRSS